jgi:hypothetical protein
MPDGFDVRVSRGTAPGEDYFRRQARTLAERGETTGMAGNRLDSEPAREEHRQLLHWFYYEKDRQAANRLEMAIDADFYDNLQ